MVGHLGQTSILDGVDLSGYGHLGQPFIVSTATTSHIIIDKTLYEESKPQKRQFKDAFGSVATTTEVGDVVVDLFGDTGHFKDIRLRDCCYLEGFRVNMISFAHLADDGYQLQVGNERMELIAPDGKILVKNNLCVVFGKKCVTLGLIGMTSILDTVDLSATAHLGQPFVISSVTTSHIIKDQTLYKESKEENRQFQHVLGPMVTANRVGVAEIDLFGDSGGEIRNVILRECCYLEKVEANILSLAALRKEGYKVEVNEKFMEMFSPDGKSCVKNKNAYIVFGKKSGTAQSEVSDLGKK